MAHKLCKLLLLRIGNANRYPVTLMAINPGNLGCRFHHLLRDTHGDHMGASVHRINLSLCMSEIHTTSITIIKGRARQKLLDLAKPWDALAPLSKTFTVRRTVASRFCPSNLIHRLNEIIRLTLNDRKVE